MLQPDPATQPNVFNCQPSETINLVTSVDKAPFLAQFPPAPTGGAWATVVQDKANLPDTRTFVCPAAKGNSIRFVVSCDERIAAGDPDPTAHYTLTFTSITNPLNPPAVFNIGVPQGLGPIPSSYTFNVV